MAAALARVGRLVSRLQVPATQEVDLSTVVGDLELPNPVMTAAGTYGLGGEFDAYGNLAELGAFVTKSLSYDAWRGNSGRNISAAEGGAMLNSVGLSNCGVSSWVTDHYPALTRLGARIVVSIWGRNEGELFDSACLLAACENICAIEVNLSCPNVEDAHLMVSHDPGQVGLYVAAVTEAVRAVPIVVWAKLAPSTPDIVACAQAAERNGASAVTLINTMSAMEVDLQSYTATLSGVFGGLSGPPLHPIALRAIYQVHSALPKLPIVGVGGVCNARTALELMAVGASAVQIGTASFADPRAPYKILGELRRWFGREGVTPSDVVGRVRVGHLPEEFGHDEPATRQPDTGEIP